MLRTGISVVAFLLFFTGCGGNAVPSDSPDVSREVNFEVEENEFSQKIIAFGDSLTEGYGLDRDESYPSQLQQKLISQGYEQYEVINSGVSGETSRGALSRVDFILSQEPDIVILEIGANDALRGIDLSSTEQNIDEIITRLKASGITVILAGMQITENLGRPYITQFADLYPSLAGKHNTPFIPSFLAGVGGVPDLNIADGIHPNEEGYRIIVEENVWPVLEEVLE